MQRCFLSLWCPDVAGDRLTRLVEWCDLYSPFVAQDGDDGIILDITGCAHLFGGEGPLLLDLRRRLHRMGVEARGAIADSRSIAWAMARYGNTLIAHGEDAVPLVDCMPVEALQIPAEMIAELRRLGLHTIASVRKTPRQSLTVRFGSTLIRRIDQMFHQAAEPLTPWHPPPVYRAARISGEPIATLQAVEYVLQELLKDVCTRLEKHHLGSRHMDFTCYRVDGNTDHVRIRMSKPTRSSAHLMRLFSETLHSLNAGFGFETFVLSVVTTEALRPTQLSLAEAESEAVREEASFDALVDRLGVKLGFSEVNRIQVCESYLPEHAVKFRPAVEPDKTDAMWPAWRVRPLRLIEPPMRIGVSVLIPGGSPVQFFIGDQQHRIVRAEGPEILTSEWWREPRSRGDKRDYYRVENQKGFRFWIFRDSSDSWFLHGHLP